MAITNASRLADFSSGIGTGGAILQVDNSSKEVGIGTTNPNATLTVNYSGIAGTSLFVHGDARVTGVLTATNFSGDLTGAVTSSGALSVTDTTASTSTTTGALKVSGGVGIAKSLFVGEGISVGGTITYDDVTNIDSVGIVTAGKGFRATTGGLIVTAGVSTFTNAIDANSSADISGGVNLSAGNLKVTAGIASVGAGLTLSSDFIHLTDNSKIQLGIASDLQIYHDGSNSYIQHDGTGDFYIKTGQSNENINIYGGQGIYLKTNASENAINCNQNGAVELFYDNSTKFQTVGTGVSVYGGMKVQSGLLRENVNIVANKLSAAPTISVDNGMMHYFTTQETTTTKPNIISSAGINTDMAIGDTMCLTVITTAASGGYSFDWRVDGVEASAGVTSSWVGGSAPSAGNASGLDTYSLTFIKTASARYTMIGNLINSA